MKCNGVCGDSPFIVQKGATLTEVAEELGMSRKELIADLRANAPDALGRGKNGYFLKEGAEINLGGHLLHYTYPPLNSGIWAAPSFQRPVSPTQTEIPESVQKLKGTEAWITVTREGETIKYPGTVSGFKVERSKECQSIALSYQAQIHIPKGTKGVVVNDGSIFKSTEGEERTMLVGRTYTLDIEDDFGREAKIIEQTEPVVFE